MMKTKRAKVYPKKTPSKQTLTEPVEVYCRIRPLETDIETACITQLDDRSVQLYQPEASGVVKGTQHYFHHVFGTTSSQKEVFDHVGMPLVRDLLHGKNGLIFTYGITGSGKTYTMTGSPQDGGIFHRTLDVLFNSIKDVQAKKCTFRPDRQNGFDPQSDTEAAGDRRAEKVAAHGKTPKTPRRRVHQRVTDNSSITDIDEDNVYSVFITYIEIYNNFVYDLLEDNKLTVTSKHLREDPSRNMYVEKAVEVEVTSTEEALQCLERGQLRRKVAHTQLNTESSRSHTVFTLRIVQAPVDEDGEEVLQDKNIVCVSQLSLVDLAGSERTNRTNNTGDRLREAGNINASLMTLRNCIEILRLNQKNGDTKMVPYRESRITHLFKNYFDGEGKVKMIVCVNPRAGDYEEAIHVMKFAEATQEVQISLPSNDRRYEIGLTPGRRRFNQNYKDAMKNLPPVVPMDLVIEEIEPRLPLVPDVMSLESLSILRSCLEQRHEDHKEKIKVFEDDGMSFRARLHNLYVDNSRLSSENSSLQQMLGVKNEELRGLENRLRHCNAVFDNYKRDEGQSDYKQRMLQRKNEELEALVAIKEAELRSLRIRAKDKISEAQEKTEKKVKDKYKQATKGLKHENKNIRTRLAEIEALAKGTPQKARIATSNSDPSLHSMTSTPASSQDDLHHRGRRVPPKVPPKPVRFTPVPVSNPRHRRSRSVGDAKQKWLDHQTPRPVPLNTVFQPKMKHRRSATQLNIKDVNSSSKYLLCHQEQDTDGELETMLVKGDILPTCGGGSQVVFQDVEVLKQTSPTSACKRRSESENVDPTDRCNVAIEGHKRTRFV